MDINIKKVIIFVVTLLKDSQKRDQKMHDTSL